jgi:hypothetical protein
MITWQVGFMVGGLVGAFHAQLGFIILAVVGLLALVGV